MSLNLKNALSLPWAREEIGYPWPTEIIVTFKEIQACIVEYELTSCNNPFKFV